MCEATYDNYTENPEAFMEFLEEADKLLYNGCKRYTKLSAIVKLYNTKAKHGMSDALFSDLLMDFGDMIPDNHKLPTKMYDVKKTLSCLALSHEKIHACSNYCILYRKQYKDCVNCPKCGLSRWKLTKKNVEKKGVPAKVLWYFPPIPRFKRMFKSLHTSKNLTWHAGTTGVPGQLCYPADSPSWKLVDHMWPDFESEPRNLRLALAADGINPYSNFSSRYSCWPIMLVTYNLPPNMSYGNLSGCTTHGYYACPVWKEDNCTKHLENGKKMSFVGNRRFLPQFHPYRRQMKELDGMEEHGESYTPLSGVALFDKIFDIRCVFGKKISVKGKTKDNVAARLDMVQLGVRHELVIDVAKLDKLKSDLVVTLGLLEKYFPLSFFDVMLHLTVHLVKKFDYVDQYKDERWIQDAHNKKFIDWFRAKVDAEIDSCNGGTTSTLTWLGHGGPRGQVIKYSSYVINGNLYQTKARDDERVCQNSGVSLVASTRLVFSAKDKNPLLIDVTFYGVIEEIWDLDYHQFQVPLFKCSWVSNDKGVIKNDDCGFTLVNMRKIGHKKDSFVLASQVNQVFYIDDPLQKGGQLKKLNGSLKNETNATVEMIQGVHDDKLNEVTNAEHPVLTDGEEHHVDLQRNKRGPTLMGKLIATARWGKKAKIDYDDMGRPAYNANGRALPSYIGSIARAMVPII
ncbi:uncharacterized protein [Primulina eburnea]|uniref:uncharacterized protein n=1 Tax=Primulina eburnea TaxID=1245227 RepID=UPI003C6C0C2F